MLDLRLIQRTRIDVFEVLLQPKPHPNTLRLPTLSKADLQHRIFSVRVVCRLPLLRHLLQHRTK